ncbi:MAG: hypothetical protein MJ252_15225 [archaeon]|nr:hypothetical protein [archaeon]
MVIPKERSKKALKELGEDSAFNRNILCLLVLWKIFFVLLILFGISLIVLSILSFKNEDVGFSQILFLFPYIFMIANGGFGLYNSLAQRKRHVLLQTLSFLGLILLIILVILLIVGVLLNIYKLVGGKKAIYIIIIILSLILQVAVIVFNFKINKFYIEFTRKIFKESVITGTNIPSL